MDCIIRFENVTKRYGENLVIPGLDLCIAPGEFVAVVGRSGCGKTTVLKMVNALVVPDSGTVYVDGKDVAAEDHIQLRRGIGYAIQGSGLFPHMTVAQNIAYVPNLLNGRDKQRTKEAMQKWTRVVGLDEDILSRYPDELSGGQQQRVGIARSLAASPAILLMDEPFGAVDEITRKSLQDEIKRIHSETKVTVMFVTHDVGEAMKLATKILVLDAGQIAQYDAPDVIHSAPASAYVRELFQGV